MAWHKRRYHGLPRQRADVESRFERLWKAHGSPRDMLMVEQAHAPEISTLWLRLPNNLETVFPELEPGVEDDLPVHARLLMGDPQQFEALFRHYQEKQGGAEELGQPASARSNRRSGSE